MAIIDELQKSTTELVGMDMDELELELGRRLKINDDDYTEKTELSMAEVIPAALDSAELAGPREFLRNLAKCFLSRFNRQLYSLVCNPDDPENPKVKNAVAGGAEKVALVLSGILAAQFAWLPAIAAVIAAMVAKRAVMAAHEGVCDAWKKEIEVQ